MYSPLAKIAVGWKQRLQDNWEPLAEPEAEGAWVKIATGNRTSGCKVAAHALQDLLRKLSFRARPASPDKTEGARHQNSGWEWK